MKGSTNALGKKQGEVEMLNLSLLTNQLSHEDLVGATFTVEYGSASKTYTWEGIALTINVPAYVDYTVTFGEVEGYRKPSSVTYTVQNGNRRTLNAKYETEVVSVTLAADDNSSVNGAQVTINGKSHTWNGSAITQKVPFGTTYSVVPQALSGYSTPASQTGIVASQSSRNLSFTYIASALKVNILSNQDNDSTIAAVKATVAYGSTSVEVSNGEQVNVPADTAVTITFPEVENYKTPDPISFTHTGGLSEKSGTYKCELLTVNVTADSGTPTGFEVTISKQETVGVATKYTKLEYIEATGTQYIDTGFVPTINTTVVASLLIPSGAGNKNLFCAYTNFALNSMSDEKLEYRVGTGNWTQIATPSTVTSRFDVEFSCKDIKFNETTIASPNLSSLSNTYTLWLFSRSGSSSTYYGHARIYSFKIYDNGILVRNYIPALRSDGIAGLYDVVNDTFTASSGSGNFLYGSIEPTIVAVQTSVTGSYKIPFDASYTVSASKVNGYDTPASVTRVASAKSYTVAQQYTVITVRDLSLYDVYGNPIQRSTANCYVVREVGQYKFPLVYGNAIKNGQVNTAAFTNNGGTYSHDFVHGLGDVITQPYLNNDYDPSDGYGENVEVNADENGALENVHAEDGYIFFTVNNIPSAGANIVLSYTFSADVLSQWSWHIWLWPHDLTPVEITNSTGVKYNIMPVNLASKYDSDGVHIKNWFYQWGRPNPMLLPSAWNSTTDHTPGSITKTSKASSLDDGFNNPSTFYYNSSSPYNWFGDKSYYNLWDAACTGTGNSDNDTVKTVYDPCPVGWKVPNGNTFTGLSIISNANGIVKMARYSGDTTGVEFPLSGSLRSSDGTLYNVGSYGSVWLSSAYTQDEACRLGFNSSNVYPQNTHKRAMGFSVRPVEDDNIQLEVIMISFTINDSTYQAESGMTWFEWVNSDYNTVGATITLTGSVMIDGWKLRGELGVVIPYTENIIGGFGYST